MKNPIYMPILRARGGEFEALAHLDQRTKENLFPLVDIPRFAPEFRSGRPGETCTAYLMRKVKQLVGTWGCDPDRRILVDSFDSASEERTDKGLVPISVFFEELRKHSSNAIPVTSLDRDDSYQQAVASVQRQDGRGVGIRLSRRDVSDVVMLRSKLETVMRTLGAERAASHLIVDFRELAEDQVGGTAELAAQVLDSLDGISEWSSVSVSAGRMPESLTKAAPSGTISTIARDEVALFNAIEGKEVRRTPMFSDYGVVHPKGQYIPRDEPIAAAPTIRYAADTSWTVVRGVSSRKDATAFKQFHGLAQKLKDRPEFKDPTFSWGDRYIDECARCSKGPGNLKKWVAVGTNHHMAHVVDQLLRRGIQ